MAIARGHGGTTLAEKLAAVAKVLKTNFTLNSKAITYEEAFSDTGLLPGFVQRAEQLCNMLLGYGLGASFDQTKDSMLGVKVTLDPVTPDSLRVLFITDVICELIHQAPSRDSTPLDELRYE